MSSPLGERPEDGRRLKILIVTHYFPPEIGAPQARLGEFARFWAEEGEEVTVLTTLPNHPTGIVPEEYRGRLRFDENTDGYRVVRTWGYATPNQGIIKKTLGHLSFMFTGPLLGLSRLGSLDVVVVSSPTFFSIFSAWVIARIKKASFVVEVRDLWPAIFVELGVLTNRVIIRLLERLELWSYRQADAVVAVSEGFRTNIVQRGISSLKVHTIKNGVDLTLFASTSASSAVRRELGPSGGCLVLYIGAHGISHGLEDILEAAALLEGEAVHFALVGEGATKEALLGKRDEMQLSNVTMLPGVPRERVLSLIAAADVCLVPLRDVPLFKTFIPSKIFEFLGAKKAVVGSVAGEAAEILKAAGAVVVPPGDSKAIASAVLELSEDAPRRHRMGKHGRSYVEQNFDRRRLAANYLSILRRTTMQR